MVNDVIIQLTGGVDSTVLAYYLKDKYQLHAVFIYYDYPPQRKEIEIVKDLVKNIDIELKVIDFSSYIKSFDLPPISSINYRLRYQYLIEILAAFSAYPNFNTVAVGWLKGEWERWKAVVDEISHSLKLSIIAPFSEMSKAEVIKLGSELNVDFSKTWSCIISGKIHCGFCVPCRSRKRAFNSIKMKDPTNYYYNIDPNQIDELVKKLSFEELYEKYLKPFLQYTAEYPKEFVDNYVNIMKKCGGKH